MNALELTNRSLDFFIMQLITDSEEDGFIIINKILNKLNSLLKESYFENIVVEKMIDSNLTEKFGISNIKDFITIYLIDMLRRSKFISKYNCKNETKYNDAVFRYLNVTRTQIKDVGFVFVNTDIISTFRPVKIIRCGSILEVKHE